MLSSGLKLRITKYFLDSFKMVINRIFINKIWLLNKKRYLKQASSIITLFNSQLERRKRDSNPRTGSPVYTLSKGTSSAT